MPASSRRRAIAARCQLTGEPRATVAPLIGRHGSPGLDDCTEPQRRFRAQLALFLLDATLTDDRGTVLRHLAADKMWSAWARVNRLLPHRDALVATTNSLPDLRHELTGGDRPGSFGMPGLRFLDTDRPGFVHLPTGARLGVQVDGATTLSLTPAHPGDASGLASITPKEQQLLDSLPSITADAEQLLAALLIRLPLADPDGIWTLSKGHLDSSWNRNADPESHFLSGTDSWWHFRWGGPIGAFDIAAALTDTRTGLDGATTLLRPGYPLTIRYGSASLALLGAL